MNLLVGSDGKGGLLNGTVPYEGLRPGRPAADGNVQDQSCYKTYHGHHKTGSWQTHVVPVQVSTVVPDYTTEPIYQWGWVHTISDCKAVGSVNIPNPPTPSPPSKILPASSNKCTTSAGNKNGHWTVGSWLPEGTYQRPTGSHTVTNTVPTNYSFFQWDQGSDNSIGGTNCFPTTQTPANQGSQTLPSGATVRLPNRPIVATPADAPIPAKTTAPPKDLNYDPYAEANWGCDSSQVTGPNGAFVQKGQWNLGSPPGPGWGLNQNGGNLPAGGYIFDYPFTNLDPATAGNIHYTLDASYEGYQWNWLSQTSLSSVQDNPEAAANLLVYGTRNSG
jgi:hypothetical protein